MNVDKLRQLESVFAEAVKIEDSQLDLFLRDRCGNDSQLRQAVIDLIHHDRTLTHSDFLEKPKQPIALPAIDSHALLGKRLGAFLLERHLGSGGMGDVYLGVRDDQFKQKAAVKLVRAGAGGEKIAERFRKEMQFLASLGKHPNITSILDAGTNEMGQLYIAMEYVEGQPINEFCDSRRVTIRERLELFCKACEAIQFAHQNAVLHRDLKPSNLMVTSSGQPMLIDFGLAKLVEHDNENYASSNQSIQHAFTPGYASPEQIDNRPATTASDVYSLGAILYELLSGQRPHQLAGKTFTQAINLVCGSDPLKPSQTAFGDVDERHEIAHQDRIRGMSRKRLRRQLNGDLDRIVMKAISRDVEQRYKTVEQLTDDIHRYLNGEPVKAQTASLGYRTKKYLQRNAVAVGFVLMLVAGIVITSRLALSASRAAAAQRKQAVAAELAALAEREQRMLAEQREQTANRVVTLFDKIVASADPRVTGNRDYPARELIHRFTEELESMTVGDPIVEARLLRSLAAALTGVGDYTTAKKKIMAAIRLLKKHVGPDQVETVAAELQSDRLTLLQAAPKIAKKWLAETAARDNPARRHDAQ